MSVSVLRYRIPDSAIDTVVTDGCSALVNTTPRRLLACPYIDGSGHVSSTPALLSLSCASDGSGVVERYYEVFHLSGRPMERWGRCVDATFLDGGTIALLLPNGALAVVNFDNQVRFASRSSPPPRPS